MEENKCPHKHEFGVDSDRFEECLECDKWVDCNEQKGCHDEDIDIYAPDSIQRLPATIYNLRDYIPGCKDLYDEHEEDKARLYDDPSSLLEDFRELILQWLHETSDKEIIATVSPIHPAAKIFVHSILPKKYRRFFRVSSPAGIPNDFVAPTPFLVMRHREGINQKMIDGSVVRWFPIPPGTSLNLKYGKTRMQVRGTALEARDMVVTLALFLLAEKKVEPPYADPICFETDHAELAKTMCAKNPRDPTIHKANWGSLWRLHEVHIDFKNKKGGFVFGGILNKLKRLEEDSAGNIGIYLDRDFYELINDGFVRPPDLRAFFKLPSKERNLYMYLMRQKSFNQLGRLYGIDVRKVYRTAGLGGIHPGRKSMAHINRTLKRTLTGLQEKNLLVDFSLKDDKVEIVSKKRKRFRRKETKNQLYGYET
jgi:hypothetical protein